MGSVTYADFKTRKLIKRENPSKIALETSSSVDQQSTLEIAKNAHEAILTGSEAFFDVSRSVIIFPSKEKGGGYGLIELQDGASSSDEIADMLSYMAHKLSLEVPRHD